MSSQHDLRIPDAFTRSSTASPDSGIHLSDGVEGAICSRKRKRADDAAAQDLLKDTFVVKPYPPKPPLRTHTLQPVALLPRVQLPLSSLDIHPSFNPLPPSRLFETHVKILELEERMGNQPMVLIARHDDGRTLFAVEREDRGLYAICKLGSWINIRHLRALATATISDISTLPEKKMELDNAITVQAPALSTVEPVTFSKKKRLAIEAIQSMIKRPTTGLLPESQVEDLQLEAKEGQTTICQNEPVTAAVSVESQMAIQPTTDDMLETIRVQYFDALYLSKASLAYFAKGPLSRARAAFHLDFEASLNMNDLVTFLEGLVLSTNLLDKKYRDGLPSSIALIDIVDHSGNDATKTKAKRKKSIKKMKPGKNGLYPNEDENVRKWWAAHDDDFEAGVPGRTREDMTKTRLASLRIRETQLQMILILEILALKPLTSVVEEDLLGLPGDSQDVPATRTSKAKRSEDLSILMDVHIDRLCIWQSLSLETVKTDNADSHLTLSANKHTENVTRDFCVDIIAPFFAARLPEQCVAINKKLGGPINVSPPKRKLTKSASISGNISRPGAATKRPVPPKPRKSLTRVLSDERQRERRSVSAQPNRKISLLRSATMPVLPGFKREGSDVSLLSIPSAESQSQNPVNKSGFTSSKRFGHREVDFTSLARDESAKIKKQASIKDELKDAIAALKKPNRELAGKTFAETIEQRTIPLSMSRKSKKPVRNPLFQSVQISATPKINRQNDIFSKSQNVARPEAEEYELVPLSSTPRIPQSSIPASDRRSLRDQLLTTVQATPSRKVSTTLASSGVSKANVLQDTPLPRNPLLNTIQATPSRKSASQPRNTNLIVSRAPSTSALPSSLHIRRSSASLFTSVPNSAMKPPPQDQITPNTELSSFEETPIKQRTILDYGLPVVNVEGKGHGHTLSPFGNNKENKLMLEAKEPVSTPEDSIYMSLGWDDGDLDELG